MHFQRLISSTAWSLTSLLCAITVCWGQYLTSSSSVFLPPGQRWESPGRVKQMWAAALQLQRCPCVRHSQLTWMDLPVCFSSITWREGKRGGKGCEWQYCWQPWPYSPVRGVGYFKKRHKYWSGKTPSLQCRWACGGKLSVLPTGQGKHCRSLEHWLGAMHSAGLLGFAYSNWELLYLLSVIAIGCQQEEGWILHSVWPKCEENGHLEDIWTGLPFIPACL